LVIGEVAGEKGLGGEDGDAGEFCKDKEVAIAGDDVVGGGGDRDCQDDSVVGVAQVFEGYIGGWYCSADGANGFDDGRGVGV
jgi:hypothetical protein